MSQKLGLVPSEDISDRRLESESYKGGKLCKPGDLVQNRLKAHLGAFATSRHSGVISPDYTVLTPISEQVRAEYYELVLKSPICRGELRTRTKGLVEGFWRLYTDDFYTIRLPAPPPDELDIILRYARHLDQRVNRLIKAKRRLIELLNEQKQAIIHQAVTRGLDPTVPLKPSGIDWLGDVPVHWRVMRVRHIAEMLVSNVDKHSHEDEEPVRLCNYVDVYKNEAITDDLRFMRATASKEEVLRFQIRIGDVIITKDSELWSDIGVPAVVRHESDDLVCGYHLAILRPHQGELSGEFLLRCFQDRLIATQLHVAANGITRYGLSQDSIKSCQIPVPPLSEQRQLVDDLAEATRDLTLAAAKSRSEIDLIREYRTRLVAEVVTGQLDVRGLDLPDVESELPVDADEPYCATEEEVDEESLELVEA